MKNPRLMVMYFGNRAAISLPALERVRYWKKHLIVQTWLLRNGVFENGREDCRIDKGQCNEGTGSPVAGSVSFPFH